VSLQLPDELCLRKGLLPPALFNEIRRITAAYVLREHRHAVLRMSHFFLSLAVCISMHTGMWWVNVKGSLFVMMFFSTMCSCCGVVDGLIGFIWGRWEDRSIREFQSEVELARRVYAQEGVHVK